MHQIVPLLHFAFKHLISATFPSNLHPVNECHSTRLFLFYDFELREFRFASKTKREKSQNIAVRASNTHECSSNPPKKNEDIWEIILKLTITYTKKLIITPPWWTFQYYPACYKEWFQDTKKRSHNALMNVHNLCFWLSIDGRILQHTFRWIGNWVFLWNFKAL